MLFVLLVCVWWIHCSLADSLTSDQQCGTLLFDSCFSHCLVECCCLIKGFCIAGPVCGVSICSQWFILTKEVKLWWFLSCLSKWAVEQTVEVQVSRKLTELISCYCNVICHSVIDDITGPVCAKPLVTSGFPSQGIAGVGLWWSSVKWFHRWWIPLI